MKKVTRLFFIISLFFMQSCAESDPLKESSEPIKQQFQLSVKALGMEATELTNINAYLFSAGTLVSILADLPLEESTATLYVPINTQIYFLAGLSTLPSSLNSLEAGKTSLKTFQSLCANSLEEAQAGSATLFYTGHYEGSKDAGQTTHEIKMTRSVARLDLDTSSDPLIKINRIIAHNLPLSSVLFAGGSAVAGNIGTGTVEKVFDTPASGKIEGFMYLFESSSSISLTLHATYGVVPITVNVSISSIQRNTIYTVAVKNIGSTVNGSISIKPWEEGNTVVGKPDLNQNVSIDLSHTVADAGMTIDDKANHITISENGGDLTLALSAGTALEIASVEGLNPLITIGKPVSVPAGDQLITTLPISTAVQERGRLPYQVKISLKSPLMQNPYDYVTIDVEGNRDQIPTVSFGGLEFMAFNSVGAELSDQFYLPEGVSILDAYTNHWAECTGRMFQFGRMPGYYPNETMKRNDVKPADLPSILEVWDESNGAPCPDGFRMATGEELHRLFPQSQSDIPIDGTVPILYRRGDKVAKWELIVPDAITAWGKRVVPRYVRLTCEQETLYFPMAGYVNNGNTAGYIGERFFLMASDRNKDASSTTKAYGYAAPIWKNQHSDSQQRMVNNFNFVRCVKK